MVIKLEQLSIGYPGVPVGTDISLSIESGNVLCLLGPNGSGKTTLFKTMLGLIPAKSGKIMLKNRLLDSLSRKEIAQLIAYVPQAHASPFAFEVLEIVLMGRTSKLGMFSQPGETDKAIARAALARLEIEDLADADYTRLSGGQRQLVLIARALAQQTSVLVLDEPTASLDFGNQVRVLKEIAGLANDGLTVILSTHVPDHAFAVGTKVALLHEGGIQRCGTPKQALTAKALSDAYGVQVRVDTLPDGKTVCVPSFARAQAGKP